MKVYNTIAVSILLLASSVASASTGSIGVDVQSAAGNGNVSVVLENGVATLSGRVENSVDANAAVRAASSFHGVDEVISYIFVQS